MTNLRQQPLFRDFPLPVRPAQRRMIAQTQVVTDFVAFHAELPRAEQLALIGVTLRLCQSDSADVDLWQAFDTLIARRHQTVVMREKSSPVDG